MKTKLLMAVFLASPLLATGPKYGPNYDVNNTNLEFQNAYQDIANVLTGDVRISSVTVSSLTVTSQLDMRNHKITNLANGTASTDAATVGQLKVLQVVSSTSTTTFTTTSSAFQTTNCSASITPTSASNKIMVIATGELRDTNMGTANAVLSIFRGTANLGGGSTISLGNLGGGAGSLRIPTTTTITDTPNSTSAVTYAVKIKNDDNATTVDFNVNSETAMTLMEVAP